VAVAAADAGAAVVVAPVVDAGARLVAEVVDAGAKVAVAAVDAGAVAGVTTPDAGAAKVVVANGGSDFERYVTEAKLAVQKQRWNTAVSNFRKAVAIQPDSNEAREGLGLALVSSETGFREAIPLLQAAAKADPGNSQVWLALGEALQNTGRDHEARGPYNEYLKLKPTGETANEIREALKQIK